MRPVCSVQYCRMLCCYAHCVSSYAWSIPYHYGYVGHTAMSYARRTPRPERVGVGNFAEVYAAFLKRRRPSPGGGGREEGEGEGDKVAVKRFMAQQMSAKQVGGVAAEAALLVGPYPFPRSALRRLSYQLAGCVQTDARSRGTTPRSRRRYSGCA
eukprot:3115877-Rhodomonas_salina.1